MQADYIPVDMAQSSAQSFDQRQTNERRISEISDSDFLEPDKERLKLLCGQFVFVINLILNVTTFIGILLVITRTSLDQDINSSIKLEERGPEKWLRIEKDISIGKQLLLGESLQTNGLFQDQLYISANDHDDEQGVALALDQEQVFLQAQFYGSNEREEFQFIMPSQVKELNVLNSLDNIRSIRSTQINGQVQDISITSKDQLELSGNLGVNAYASHTMELESPIGLSFESKGDAVILQLNGGSLLLPQLPILSDKETFTSLPLAQSIDRLQLCIDSKNGLLYQASQSCS